VEDLISQRIDSTMSERFTINGGKSVGGVKPQQTRSYGIGRAELPILAVNLSFTAQSPDPRAYCLDLRELRCRIATPSRADDAGTDGAFSVAGPWSYVFVLCGDKFIAEIPRASCA